MQILCFKTGFTHKDLFGYFFSTLLVRARLKHGLIINRVIAFQVKVLKDVYSECLRQMYGAYKSV